MHTHTRVAMLGLAVWAVLAGPGCNGRRYVMTGDPVEARARALTTLHRAARDADNYTRAKAIEAMVDVRGTRGGHAYVTALDDSAPNVRFAAAVAVGDLKYAPARPRILAMARYKQPGAERQWSVYCGVVYAMHRMGHPEQTGRLGKLLFHEGPVVRANAAMVMGRLGEPSAIAPLRSLYEDEQKINVKLQALESMARLGDAWSMDKIESHAIDPFPVAKLVALRLMSELGARRTVMPLCSSIVSSQHQQPQARVLAAGAMARRGTVTDYAYDLCLTSAGDPAGVMKAAMGGAYDARTADPMMATTLRRLAVISLGWMKRTHAVDVLEELLDDPDGGVRVGAAMSILRLLGPTMNGPRARGEK